MPMRAPINRPSPRDRALAALDTMNRGRDLAGVRLRHPPTGSAGLRPGPLPLQTASGSCDRCTGPSSLLLRRRTTGNNGSARCRDVGLHRSLRLEHLERILAQILGVASPHVVETYEQTVIHDVEAIQKGDVALQLSLEERKLLRAELDLPVAVNPVEILENGALLLLGLLLGVLAPDGGAFEIIRLVDVSMRWEQVVHDDEVNLASVRELDAMQTVEATEERMGVRLDMLVVVFEDGEEELVLRMSDCLDDEAIVSREVEERSGFAG